MNQYIMFFKKQKAVHGYHYEPNTKYKIQKQDEKYYYAMSDKVVKIQLPKDQYIIGNIVGDYKEKEESV